LILGFEGVVVDLLIKHEARDDGTRRSAASLDVRDRRVDGLHAVVVGEERRDHLLVGHHLRVGIFEELGDLPLHVLALREELVDEGLLITVRVSRIKGVEGLEEDLDHVLTLSES